MANVDEFWRLIRKAGVIPYRRVGRIRIVFDPALPAKTRAASIEAVRVFAPALAHEWEEPTQADTSKWDRLRLLSADVCDDPVPPGIDLLTCTTDWILQWSEQRYHFRLTRPANDQLLGVAMDGWDMDKIRPLLPRWYVDLIKIRRQSLTEYLPLSSPS